MSGLEKLSGFKFVRFSRMQMKNFAVAGTLSMFVVGVYVYTMKAVGGSDEMEAAIEQFEKEKSLKSQKDATV